MPLTGEKCLLPVNALEEQHFTKHYLICHDVVDYVFSDMTMPFFDANHIRIHQLVSTSVPDEMC
jgi:hypothetical protein